jgi:hypothetical protein
MAVLGAVAFVAQLDFFTVNVALLVALTAADNAVSGYDHAWWVQAGAGLRAIGPGVPLALARHRFPARQLLLRAVAKPAGTAG